MEGFLDEILKTMKRKKKVVVVWSPYVKFMLYRELKKQVKKYNGVFMDIRQVILVDHVKKLQETREFFVVTCFWRIDIPDFVVLEYFKIPYPITVLEEKFLSNDRETILMKAVDIAKRQNMSVLIFVGNREDVAFVERKFKENPEKSNVKQKSIWVSSDLPKSLIGINPPLYVIDTSLFTDLALTYTGGRRTVYGKAPRRITEIRKLYAGILSSGVYHIIGQAEQTEQAEQAESIEVLKIPPVYFEIVSMGTEDSELGPRMTLLYRECSEECHPLIKMIDDLSPEMFQRKPEESLAEFELRILKYKNGNIRELAEKNMKSSKRILSEIERKAKKIFPVMKHERDGFYRDKNGKTYYLLSPETPERIVVFQNIGDEVILFMDVSEQANMRAEGELKANKANKACEPKRI